MAADGPTVHSVDSRISAHEQVCAERWEAARDILKDLKFGVKNLYWIVFICAGVLICGMAGLIVTLTVHAK